MGAVITPATYRKAESSEELVVRFAQIMRDRYRATVYQFGSRARGSAGLHSDYDFVAVSELFENVKPGTRVGDRVLLWFEAGGWGEGLDLHCYTPEEFAKELDSGMGYLAEAARRSELVEVSPGAATR